MEQTGVYVKKNNSTADLLDICFILDLLCNEDIFG